MEYISEFGDLLAYHIAFGIADVSFEKFVERKKTAVCEWWQLPDGSKHGKEIGTDPFGNKRFEMNHSMGERDGSHVCFGEKGVYYEACYSKGEKDGMEVWYHNNGSKKCEIPWKNGRISGRQISWFWSGDLRSIQEYKDGKKHGVEKVWNKDGVLIKKLFWSKDKKHGPESVIKRNGVRGPEKIWKFGILSH